MNGFTTVRSRGSSGPVWGELSSDPAYAELRRRAPGVAELLASGRVIKRDQGHAVLALDAASGGPGLLCKFFPERGFGDRLRQRIRLDRPARIHRRLRPLAAVDLPIPTTLGHLAAEGLGSAWFCTLLPGRNLLHWAGEQLPDSGAARLALLSPVIDAMLRLHTSGYRHGDFKWGNVLVDEDTGACYLVDTDDLRVVPPRGVCRGKARDLARFLLDCREAGVPDMEAEALRRRYAEGAGLPVPQVERLVAPLLERLGRRHARRYGEGRRLMPLRDES